MPESRADKLERLRRKAETTVLVIGGGINGISVFRELALQGVDVVLAEAGDFMSGASAAPSRMIHGGLRYMENGEFELVKESLKERNLLLRNAPHVVSLLPTLIPLVDRFSGLWTTICRLFGGASPSGDRGAVVVRLGLTLYDLFARHGGGLPRHSFFSTRRLKARWPDLNPRMSCGALYYDAKISYPERLGVEMVLDTETAVPQALALNHLRFDGATGAEVSLTDTITGERVTLRPEIVVNATGAWVDQTNARLAAPTELIGGTKGSHLVIENAALLRAVGDSMVYFANSDGRVCIMFAHLGQVLAGSTDISVDSPDNIICAPEETAYILQSIAEVFPGIHVTEQQIRFRFAGVRPLPRSRADANAAISRDHSCDWLVPGHDTPWPVLNLVGGKWTTFRAFGADAADKVLARLGLNRARNTETSAIGGGRDFPLHPAARASWLAAVGNRTGLAPARLEILLQRYGTRAAEMASFLIAGPDAPLSALPAYSRREIEYLVRREHVVRLGDLVLRRLAIALSGELNRAALDELAAIAAAVLGWDGERSMREISDLLRHLQQMHGVTLEELKRRDPVQKAEHVLV